ncbi:MAG TPA: DUF2190 family protein [Xanthobacteraceae bacterium]|nr:DUF2190 family protein [Xanthobacteraceae bacterium]
MPRCCGWNTACTGGCNLANRPPTTGAFDLPKLASVGIAAGDRVWWDDAAKQVNVLGTGRYPIGTAIEAAGNGATIVRVRRDGMATAAA